MVRKVPKLPVIDSWQALCATAEATALGVAARILASAVCISASVLPQVELSAVNTFKYCTSHSMQERSAAVSRSSVETTLYCCSWCSQEAANRQLEVVNCSANS